jgi:ribosome-associated protein
MTKKQQANWPPMVNAIVEGIREVKGRNIHVLDFRTMENAMCDFFVVCEGNSTTQVQAIAHSIEEMARKKVGFKPHHTEGLGSSQWILMDYADILVHVFEPETRTFYDVEGLWSDAPSVYMEQ